MLREYTLPKTGRGNFERLGLGRSASGTHSGGGQRNRALVVVAKGISGLCQWSFLVPLIGGR